MKKTYLAAVVSGFMAISTTVSAGEIIVTTSQDFDGDGDMVTAAFNEFGYSGTLATSFYNYTSADAGTIVDTNIASEMTDRGYSNGTFTAIDGSSSVTFVDGSTSTSYNNIDSLNNITVPDTENFFADPGFGLGWSLSYDFILEGTFTDASGPSYTGGYIDAFYYDNDLGTSEQVFRLEVNSSVVGAANMDIFGDVIYDWDGDGISDATAFSEAFLTDAYTGKSFYELWATGRPQAITFKLDTNIDPAIPTPNTLVATTGVDGTDYVVRQAQLDGSIVFAVPEPTSLAIMGLGLLGFGAARRRKQ